MSGFEHYEREVAEMDHEIHHYATVCRIDLNNPSEREACLRVRHDTWAADPARETLHGLLMLRLKVETEMLELGLLPRPLLTSGLPPA